MNKLLKKTCRGQTAVLSAILALVGMMVLVPAVTERAQATVVASAKGTCGPEGQTHPCQFFRDSYALPLGVWINKPTEKGTDVNWLTRGGAYIIPQPERGNVVYKVEGYGTVEMYFDNPVHSASECVLKPHPSSGSSLSGSCHATRGEKGYFTYTVRGK